MMLLLLIVLPLFFNAGDDNKKKILILETDCGVDQKWNDNKAQLQKTCVVEPVQNKVSFLTKDQLQDIAEVHVYGPLDGADAFWAWAKRILGAGLSDAENPKSEVDRTAKAWYNPFLYYAIPFIFKGNKVFESPLDYIVNIDLENKVRTNLPQIVCFYTGSELKYMSVNLMQDIFLQQRGKSIRSINLDDNIFEDQWIFEVKNEDAVIKYGS